MGLATRRRERRRRHLSHLILAGTLVAGSIAAASGYGWSRAAHATVGSSHPSLRAPRAVSTPETTVDARSGSFSLLSYNVAGLPDLVSPHTPSSHMPRIARRLGGFDLVLVQEDFSHHELLERGAVHRHQSVAQGRASRLANDGLNRFSQFAFVPVTRERWHVCNGLVKDGSDCLASKGFSMAETTLAADVFIHVYNHHADAGDSERDRRTRAQQFEQLADYILSESDSRAIIVAGDTNLDPDSPADAQVLSRFLERTGLHDSCEALLCDQPQIDRVFYRSGDRVSLSPELWELAPEFGHPKPVLSDHHAVHTRFRWRRHQPTTTASAVWIP